MILSKFLTSGVIAEGSGDFPKNHFYCINTSYPMDNCFTGQRDLSCEMPVKDILYILPDRSQSVHSIGDASYFLPV